MRGKLIFFKRERRQEEEESEDDDDIKECKGHRHGPGTGTETTVAAHDSDTYLLCHYLYIFYFASHNRKTLSYVTKHYLRKYKKIEVKRKLRWYSSQEGETLFDITRSTTFLNQCTLPIWLRPNVQRRVVRMLSAIYLNSLALCAGR